MPKNPELMEFERKTHELKHEPDMAPIVNGDSINLSRLTLEQVESISNSEAGYYFLIAAAGFNRTSLRKAARAPAAKIVESRLRKAYAIQERLPVQASFSATAQKSVALRASDLARKKRGAVEKLLRDRLVGEGIPLCMSPPLRRIAGLLVDQRKPDGVYPDPDTGEAPKLLLEIKGIRRVSDDIQKRLYEIAETSLEMKILYGDLELRGLQLDSMTDVAKNPEYRRKVREQIVRASPAVVAFFICPREEAARYREGAEAFIDRVFFQEEVEDCIDFLRKTIGPGH